MIATIARSQRALVGTSSQVTASAVRSRAGPVRAAAAHSLAWPLSSQPASAWVPPYLPELHITSKSSSQKRNNDAGPNDSASPTARTPAHGPSFVDSSDYGVAAQASALASGPVRAAAAQTFGYGHTHSHHLPTELLTGGSHTTPANACIAAHGCYRVVGPATLVKRGDVLVAHLLPGSRLDLLDAEGRATPAAFSSMSSMSSMSSAASMASMSMASLSPADSHDSVPIETSTAGPAAAPLGGAGLDSTVPSVSSLATRDECEAMWEELGAREVDECVLVASHVELNGSATSLDVVDNSLTDAVTHLNGHTYVSIRHLPDGAIIDLPPDAQLSHPVNVTPPQQRKPQPCGV
ncbi:hypothetical protein HYH03_009430 [Edaphochlamys debaryana]|uniref:Uncharacterized protein n=1 Tax=Edaphochlamys debaryana TaxID=47281 RepID=A0A835XW22_9CHLO|nr:hypothetical protein HYH03_009430 [Edaphochlamys debaryana]|eukprot:KAG2492182.1 hypothetical protein HYH03_009430 [Edaphochlamys debaryana]